MPSMMNILTAMLALANFCVSVSEANVDTEAAFGLAVPLDTHLDSSYLPEFPSASRSIMGRADDQNTEDLQNNVPATTNTIQLGSRQVYRFPSDALHGTKSTLSPIVPGVTSRFEEEDHSELRKRADGDVTYYLSLSVCSQPTSNSSGNLPPQLLTFVSYSNPNADGTGPNPHTPTVVDGYTSFSDQTSGDIFVSIQAPSASGFSGSYTFELVVSIDGYYTSFTDTPTLYFVDTDNTAAMFVSGNLSLSSNGSVDNTTFNAWKKIGPQFSVYIAQADDPSLNGLMHSFCALRNTTVNGSVTDNQQNIRVETGITDIGGPALQQKFYVSGLQSGSNYLAAMGLPSNYSSAGSGQPGGGGTLYSQVAFTTKSEGNCHILYNITSCPQINYAVPFNPRRFNHNTLGAWYANQTDTFSKFFGYAIDQIACNTSSDQMYSLAVTCDDCKSAYQEWLCTVMYPRCHDYSSQKPYLHARNINQNFINGTTGSTTNDPQFGPKFQNLLAFNSSRNVQIDQQIQPGPYKELLPCGDVCNKLVRSCPAALNFGCPYNPQNYNNSYGYQVMDGNLPECNYPGMVFGVSEASTLRPMVVMIPVIVMLFLSFG